MFSLLVFALAVSAVQDPCIARIDNRGFVKSQMLDCATRDMDRADAALNARYRQVMARLSARQRDALRGEERRWIERRRATCRGAMRAPLPSPEINRMRCLVRETEARTRQLAHWGLK